jgi:hypothetical protein
MVIYTQSTDDYQISFVYSFNFNAKEFKNWISDSDFFDFFDSKRVKRVKRRKRIYIQQKFRAFFQIQTYE